MRSANATSVPSPSKLNVWLDSKVGTLQREISIDLGEPFVLFIRFDPTGFSFGLNFNGEDLDPVEVKRKEFGVVFATVNVSGDLSVNYFGFTKSGIS